MPSKNGECLNSMIYPTETAKCTGCRCCVQMCPCHAISIIEDEEGFLAPKIDESLCTNCGLCEERCPENNNPAVNVPLKVFGARYRLDDKKLYESASGGVFLALAEKFLAGDNALVFGAALDKDNVCRHIGIRDIAGIAPLQSSKYVQSDTRDTFNEAKQFLEKGGKVFYSGTPCQVAGLHAYLGKDYDNLYTADIICHGVPSPALFRMYVQMLEEQEDEGKIIYFNFRSKYRLGWNVGGYLTKTKTKTKTKYIPLYRNEHLISFMITSNCLRECCYNCRYAQTARMGDITAADFWGVQHTHPERNDKRGCSLVLVNTPKGETLAKELYNSCDIFAAKLEDALPFQRNLQSPTQRPKERDWILKGIADKGTDVFKQKGFRQKWLLLRAIKYHLEVFAPWLLTPYKAVLKILKPVKY